MSEAEQLKAFLAERDVPCRDCGYNLRGSVGVVCPECGEPIVFAKYRRIGLASVLMSSLWAAIFVDGAYGMLAPYWQNPYGQAPASAVYESLVLLGSGLLPWLAVVYLWWKSKRWTRVVATTVGMVLTGFALPVVLYLLLHPLGPYGG